MNTPREQQVIELLLKGCTNKEIGARLSIKLRTVKDYLNRLFRRYEIPNKGIKRVKLAVLIYRMQLQDAADSKKEPRDVPCQEG